ncbi:uncharacterized protein LOC142983914 [Anticarsia gemmatalis]|uniref:uncharacterized protein LOC142983914 n=1 Tax=Anticarsia gemmatalis TaxID=129554 RepID=UPI003F774902
MFPYFSGCLFFIFLQWIQDAVSMSLLNKDSLLSATGNAERGVTDFIIAKGYIPRDSELPKPSIVKNVDNDATYLLSKLSDDELVKLLSEQPNKNEYNVKDLVKITTNDKFPQNFNPISDLGSNNPAVSEKGAPPQQNAFFRLENKEVDPFASSKTADVQYAAVQKINNLLYSRPAEQEPENRAEDDDEKKELMFDVLVAQLKSLCCKRNKPLKRDDKTKDEKKKLKPLLGDIMPAAVTSKNYNPELRYSQITMPTEHMFLIINDEIKSSGNEEDALISVDPDSLSKNSSVMLLGPIATPLSDTQLRLVMMRISNELANPEYLPLLQQISEGRLSNEHIGLLDSLVSGAQSRRYMKPHRCNHQSKLARIYGGPKWLICTGYLNLNKPSLYD